MYKKYIKTKTGSKAKGRRGKCIYMQVNKNNNTQNHNLNLFLVYFWFKFEFQTYIIANPQ